MVQRRHQLCQCLNLLVVLLAVPSEGLYFYASDYASWVATVSMFRNTTVSMATGVLQMNPYTTTTVGRALYKKMIRMQNTTANTLASFNTSFVFSMNTDMSREYFGDGMAFLICPNLFKGDDLQVSSGGYLGMFNATTNGRASNKVFAVEFDTHKNVPFNDPNDNHVGVDVNSLHSVKTNDLSSLGIILNGGSKIACWIDYDGVNKYLWVYLAYFPSNKPSLPVINMDLDLSANVRESMYVGFTSATGTRAELHTVYSWWFMSGFGKLSAPSPPPSSSTSVSRSSHPLARLGRKTTVMAIFSLAAIILFLFVMLILARRSWKKRSKHLVDIFLPVACWMYWKESSNEARSARCLKLAAPPVELLAWLWRTKLARRHDLKHGQYLNYKLPPLEIVLKRKMGPHYRGEAWQEDQRRKRRKRHAPKQKAVHILIEFEEPEDSSDEDEASAEQTEVVRPVRTKEKPLAALEGEVDHIAEEDKPSNEEAARPPTEDEYAAKPSKDIDNAGRPRPSGGSHAIARRKVAPPPSPVAAERRSNSDGNARTAPKADGLARSILKGPPVTTHAQAQYKSKERVKSRRERAAPAAARQPAESDDQKEDDGRLLLIESAEYEEPVSKVDARILLQGEHSVTESLHKHGVSDAERSAHAASSPKVDHSTREQIAAAESDDLWRSDSFVVIEDEVKSDARIFQRRGSFLIPQNAAEALGATGDAAGWQEASTADSKGHDDGRVLLRRGSFSVPHESDTTGEPSSVRFGENDNRGLPRRGPFILVEDSGVSMPGSSLQGEITARHTQSVHGQTLLRRGSSTVPAQASDKISAGAPQPKNEAPDQSSAGPSKVIEEDPGNSHVAHLWLFD